MHFRVGLTGGVACGKSTVSQLFSELGVTIIDADVIARKLLEKDTDCYKQVIELFGTDITFSDGEINRALLRDLVFSDATAKHQLEKILHPEVREQMLALAETSETAYCIFVVPLLVEADMLDLVDRILVIDIPEATQLERLIKRDKLTKTQAQNILNNQATRQQRMQVANDLIDNQNDINSLKDKVEQLHHFYRELALKYNASC
ncbi:dephospho-CoA kinase [Methylophaga thiooxydans]|uniref:Dephospho-CoA kinase n=1 Tax=Methylophaga thiooxydans DMS010 TaxID=637616 RepID=C0N8V3_9GAMM|nr:dephospho-CoA kinase [Methylophaga thiooxydans]EEF78848.1 dephospho-CoA kinase [Methylophaga thiooxydans DMS010]